MPTVTSDILRYTLAGLSTIFDEAYQRRRQNAIYPKIATVVPTTLPVQDYAQLGGTPVMQQWLGERNIKSLKQLFPTYQITDATWEASMSIARRTLEDEQYGILRPKAIRLGQEPIRHREQLCVQQYALGFTTAGMDANASYFFSTTHAESSTNQSNKSTSILTANSLAIGIEAMMAFTDDQGVPLGILPDTLIVGPSNKFNAEQILHSSTIVGYGGGSNTTTPSDNPLKGAVENLLVSPYLQGNYAPYWFLIDSTMPVRGVILQEREDVADEFAALESPDNPIVFTKDEYTYGVRGRYQVGFGIWQAAYGSTGAS